MTSEHDAYAVWQVEGAPPGFADRTLQTIAQRQARTPAASDRFTRTTGRPHRRPRSTVWLWSVAIGVAAALVIVALAGRVTVQTGELVASARTTVELGERAIAVLEAGTELEWRIEGDGTARVRQASGRTFYRVEPGRPFEVSTPHAKISVLGTSFEVEVDPMDRKAKSVATAAAAAGVGALLVVTLYEGRVVIASDHGDMELSPGEVAEVRGGRPPERRSRVDEASDHETPARNELDALRSDLRAARAELARAKSQAHAPAEARSETADSPAGHDDVERCWAGVGQDGCSLLEPSQAVLDRRADCGAVAYDQPDALYEPNPDLSDLAELTGLSPTERQQLQETSQEFHNDTHARLLDLYAKLGGELKVGQELSNRGLTAEVGRLAEGRDPNARLSAQDILSATLAGRRPPPTGDELSPGQQHWYDLLTAGDRFERALAERLGAARAFEVHTAKNGWASKGFTGSPRCLGDQEDG